MTDFQRDEKNRAYARAMTHLNHMLALHRAAQYENNQFNLGIELPPEKAILEAINHCAHVYKQPGETPA